MDTMGRFRDGEYVTTGQGAHVFDAIVDVDGGFMGNIGWVRQVWAMDPERESIWTIVGGPKGGGFRAIVDVGAGPIDVRQATVQKGMEVKHQIAASVGGMMGGDGKLVCQRIGLRGQRNAKGQSGGSRLVGRRILWRS